MITAYTVEKSRCDMLNAASVVAAIAVKELRKITTDGKDEATAAMLDIKACEYAHVSIKNWVGLEKKKALELSNSMSHTSQLHQRQTRRKRGKKSCREKPSIWET